jgi:hypothetical protein
MSNYGFTSAGTSYDDEDCLTGFARASGTFTRFLKNARCEPNEFIAAQSIYDLLKAGAGHGLGEILTPEEEAAFWQIAELVRGTIKEACPSTNRTCKTFTSRGEDILGNQSSCYFSLCKTVNGSTANFEISGVYTSGCTRSRNEDCLWNEADISFQQSILEL